MSPRLCTPSGPEEFSKCFLLTGVIHAFKKNARIISSPPNATSLTQRHCFVLPDVCSLGQEDSFPGSKLGPQHCREAGGPTPAKPVPFAGDRLLQLSLAASSSMSCLVSKEGCVRDSEWKYLHPQELWEWEKKINKGKRSRAIEVKHGQRKAVKREAHVPRVNTCRKHLSHQAPCPCSEELD